MDKSCINTNVINETEIPIVTIGTNNLIIVVSNDGILISDKEQSENVKDMVNKIIE